MKDQFDEKLDRIRRLERVILNIDWLFTNDIDSPDSVKLYVKNAVSYYEIKDQPLSTPLGDFILSLEEAGFELAEIFGEETK